MKTFRPIGCAAVLLAAGAALAQQDAKEVAVKTHKVAGDVAMLEGLGGNIGVLHGADGALVVDDQYAHMAAKIRKAISDLTKGPVKFVLNTHWHMDHVGGNEGLASEGAVIVAHDNVRKRMSVDNFNEWMNRSIPASPAKALPVVTFAQNATLHFAGEDVEAHHLPKAHTDGDVVYRFRKANVLHCGDTFFNGNFPFIDLDSGGTVDGYIAAQEKILELADDQTKIIPGHGPVGDKAALRAAVDALRTARDRVKTLVDAGKSYEEIQAAKPLADLDPKWGKGWIKGDRLIWTILRGMGVKVPKPTPPPAPPRR